MISSVSFETIEASIRDVPDFPKKGILFKDITTAIKQPGIFHTIVDTISEYYSQMGITKVVAIESRGFITGGAIAYNLGAGLVPVRKPGKLPSETFSATYDLEYGKDTLQIHKDALDPHDVVLVHDDLLATGGTALAAVELIANYNISRIYLSFIIELDFLLGRQKLCPAHEVYSMVHF